MRTLNLWLLCAAIFVLIAWVIPPARTCYLPPHAPTRGFYEKCWSESELWS